MPKPLPIDTALIEHLGELARLRLPVDRLPELRDKLQQLVDAFSVLSEADFGSVTTAHPTGSERDQSTRTVTPGQLRDDLAETPPSVAEVLANAPQTAADCFVVARVVEP